MEGGGFSAAITDGDLDQDFFRRFLGIFHKDIKISIVIEYTGVKQLILHLMPGSFLVGRDQIVIGICRLRIFVEILHVRMGGRTVEVEVILFDILAMIAFAVGQAEQALLEDRILAVPERERKAEPLLVIGKAGQTIFSPAVRA